MGGMGPGRQHGRSKVESFRSINANRLKVVLSGSHAGSLEWMEDGERAAWIEFSFADDRLRLVYRYRVNDGEWQPVDQVINITRVPCRYGGTRPYFICPSCDRRVAKLNGAGKLFLCRHCHGLAYYSQSEGEVDRAMSRADKVRMRLGGQAGIARTFPRRPKGMWNRTYNRLMEKSFADEAFVNRAVLEKFGLLA